MPISTPGFYTVCQFLKMHPLGEMDLSLHLPVNEREREFQVGSVLGMGLDLTTTRSQPEPISRVRHLTDSHPGAPKIKLYKRIQKASSLWHLLVELCLRVEAIHAHHSVSSPFFIHASLSFSPSQLLPGLLLCTFDLFCCFKEALHFAECNFSLPLTSNSV